MAKGDKRIEIRSDGWSADLFVEDFAVGSTFDYGFSVESLTVSAGTADRPTPGPNTPYVLVTDLGFDASANATTVERRLYICGKVRQAYPNNASIDEEVIGGELRTRVHLSEECFAKADTGAGNSGVAVALHAPAGFVTNAGDAALSNVAAGIAGTNSSTLAYPKVIGQWSHHDTPLWERRQADFDISFRPRHGIRGVACVRFNADGQTSAASGLDTVIASRSKVQSAATGLFHDPFTANVDNDAFDQGEQIALRARAYPVIGDAASVLDTEDRNTAVSQSQQGNARVEATCNKTGALTQYAVIDPVSGNDGTGVISGTLATAQASPFLTIREAAQNGATAIRLLEGTHNIIGRTTIAISHAIEIGPLAGETPALCVVEANDGSSSGNDRRMYWEHVRFFGGITIDANGSWWDWQSDTAGRTCKLDGVICSGTAGTAPMHYRIANMQMIDCTVSGWKMSGFSTQHAGWTAIGCRFNSLGSDGVSAYGGIVACDMGTGAGYQIQLGSYSTSAATVDLGENIMVEFNKFDRYDYSSGSGRMIDWDGSNWTTGLSVVGNIFDSVDTGGGPRLYLFADGHLFPVSNVSVAHNTGNGTLESRLNAFYNDEGTASVSKTQLFYKANALPLTATKSDPFVHPTDGPNGNRTGNHSFVFGASCLYNCEDNTLFPREFLGIGSVILGTAYGDQGYTNAAGGDFTPTGSSPLAGALPREFALIEFDQNGVTLEGTSDIGAVQRLLTTSQFNSAQVTVDGDLETGFRFGLNNQFSDPSIPGQEHTGDQTKLTVLADGQPITLTPPAEWFNSVNNNIAIGVWSCSPKIRAGQDVDVTGLIAAHQDANGVTSEAFTANSITNDSTVTAGGRTRSRLL